MIKNISIYLILIVQIVSGCDPGVEMNNIDVRNLYSVSSFISPQDTTLNLYLFRAFGIGESANLNVAIVDNAIVTISDLTVTDSLYYNSETEKYENSTFKLKILPLQTYYLTVLIPPYTEIRASCTIPPTPTTAQITGLKDKDDFLFTVDWDNPSNFKYFSLGAFALGSIIVEYPEGSRIVDLSANINEQPFFPLDNQNQLRSYDGIIKAAYIADSAQLIIALRNLDEPLYNYYKSYQKFDQWNSNNEGNLLPNFQEVQPIYSNINGGVGIFGGFNEKRTVFDIN